MSFVMPFYYVATDEAVVKAAQQDDMDRARAEAIADRFANQFGARALFSKGVKSRFAGITFLGDNMPPPTKFSNPLLWTKASDIMPLQTPAPLKIVPKSLEGVSAELRILYAKDYPTELETPAVSKLLSVLGVPEENVVQHDFGHFTMGSKLYLYCTRSLPGKISEVYASEFVTALARVRGVEIDPVVMEVANPEKEAELNAALAAKETNNR